MFQEVIFVEAWYHAKSYSTCSIAFATPSAQFAPSLRPLCSGCCWNDAQHFLTWVYSLTHGVDILVMTRIVAPTHAMFTHII